MPASSLTIPGSTSTVQYDTRKQPGTSRSRVRYQGHTVASSLLPQSRLTVSPTTDIKNFLFPPQLFGHLRLFPSSPRTPNPGSASSSPKPHPDLWYPGQPPARPTVSGQTRLHTRSLGTISGLGFVRSLELVPLIRYL